MRKDQEKIYNSVYLERVHRIDNVPLLAINTLGHTRRPKRDLIDHWDRMIKKGEKIAAIMVDHNFMIINHLDVYLAMRRNKCKTCSVIVMAGLIDTQLHALRCRTSYHTRSSAMFHSALDEFLCKEDYTPKKLMQKQMKYAERATDIMSDQLDASSDTVKRGVQSLMDWQLFPEQEPEEDYEE